MKAASPLTAASNTSLAAGSLPSRVMNSHSWSAGTSDSACRDFSRPSVDIAPPCCRSQLSGVARSRRRAGVPGGAHYPLSTGRDGPPLRIQLFCADTGQVPPEWAFETSDEWQQYEVDLGPVGACDPSGLMAVIFSASQVGEYSFHLDDVVFR